MKQSQIARALALKYHEGVKRKFSGEPYFNHVERVAKTVEENGGSDEQIAAAYAHDLIEDTPVTYEDLRRAGLSGETISLIDALTRNRKDSYASFIKQVSWNRDAIIIKLADLKDNMRDLPDGTMKDKYLLAQMYLVAIENQWNT